jgi:2-dehydro-3-deoxyphosphooctonate aldolase (KDO 8-P synthase)
MGAGGIAGLVYGDAPPPPAGSGLLFILGPCVIESEQFLRDTALRIAAICAEVGAQFVLKASYDKANRTSGKSFRGLPPRAGCQLLAAVGAELQVAVTTDVHSPAEAEMAAEYIDILQIPAFLCRQTDLIHAAGRTGRIVNVKKGQFLSPWDIRPIAEKLREAGCERFFFTERGVTFGYQNLVADMRSLYWMREAGFLVCFDATHSVQRPGAGGDHTSGDGVLAPVLARAAVAAGCDAVFLEVHANPAAALSDGPNQIPLGQLGALLATLRRIDEATRA